MTYQLKEVIEVEVIVYDAKKKRNSNSHTA
jgi:hypothetical protein